MPHPLVTLILWPKNTPLSPLITRNFMVCPVNQNMAEGRHKYAPLKGFLTPLTRKENVMSKTKPETELKTTESDKPEKDLFADINVTMKTGHLVKDAALVSEGKYAKIRFASNKEYLDPNDEVKTTTNYFNALVSANLKDAFDTAKSLKKGDWVYLKGEDVTKSFDTPEGYKQTASTIFAYKVVLKKEKAATDESVEAASNHPGHPAPDTP